MRLIDSEPIIKNLSAMITQLGYDAIDIDGMIKALREAEEVTSSAPPNDPLTLDELREMEADPIWIVREDGVDRWALIRYFTSSGMNTYGCGFLSWEDMGKIWTPYRYKLVPHPQKGGPGP